MGALFRSESMSLMHIFLPSASAFACVSELGERGLCEFRDMNAGVNVFQRRFVGEIRRYEDMEHTLGLLEKEVVKAKLAGDSREVNPLAPSPRDALHIQTQTEQLMRELLEVSRNRETLQKNLTELLEYAALLRAVQRLCRDDGAPPSPVLFNGRAADAAGSQPNEMRMSTVFGTIDPQKVPAFELMLFRVCRGFTFMRSMELPEPLAVPFLDEPVRLSVFSISFWGERIGDKVRKISSCFHCRLLHCPDSQREQQELLGSLDIRIADLQSVLSQTEAYRKQVLQKAASVCSVWLVQVRKAKAVYHVLNQCHYDARNYLVGEAWCPTEDKPRVEEALLQASDVHSEKATLTVIPTQQEPPTLNRTNRFTSSFQGIVDAYGVGSYREVNPAPYTIITFPFLFAVMFGDLGHGAILLLFALWMVLKENNKAFKSSNNEIWQQLFGGRYIMLLMGLFSIYTGFIYNDCFSKPLTIFPSAWNVTAMIKGSWNVTHTNISSIQLLALDPNISGVFTTPYPFGIDPIWGLAKNQLTFLNSYKMKMSVVLGVIHMTFGVILSCFNHVHFRDFPSILLVFVPEMVFMLALFGYLVVIVIYKWVAWPTSMSNTAPSILIDFINMFMFRSSDNLYAHQAKVQMLLVVVAVLMVPVLLLGKPLSQVVALRMRRRQRDLTLLIQSEERTPLLTAVTVEADPDSEHAEVDFSDIFMHQAIHTIEYCLGCISNTASYLRLWALSLAHGELSEVLWKMVLSFGLRATSWSHAVLLVPIFGAFAVLTLSILLVMEGLSAFLHALRLHWVEFQNKFYKGSGYLFVPFYFQPILEGLVHTD
ncbi:V-type proton ATPase 116 kDa subunit a 3-like isoform X1 [Petromyzon marinus]|uniref:V-type proton ATPase subunit a n=1 Tax=Petromyzon marinus TaxID=7757 RepID=A0AAJ7TVP0_PETMA|nr:V-type proton ATPase 116 kDa subunit a-like isoform X1 [Petromyzon marinus]